MHNLTPESYFEYFSSITFNSVPVNHILFKGKMLVF